MKISYWLLLPSLARFADCALLLLRIAIGAFLVWGVQDNITSTARMAEFSEFLQKFEFAYPHLMAPLSVWAQFLVGLSFIMGLLTRWAGIICAVNFIVAIVMVDVQGGVRAAFPSACLVLIGFYLATHGPGKWSLDFLSQKKLH